MTIEGSIPSQTVGPFFAIGLPWADGPAAVADGGIWLRGRVLDGEGEPVPDALVETWQTSPAVSAEFRGFARCATSVDGSYAIRTLKPSRDTDGQAPHLVMSVFARGLLDRVVTRVYFSDEALLNADDAVLDLVGPRSSTLIAQSTSDGYVFDIRLQGADETVFFSI
jgi:protocatechuate 3,4-dioxygenase alpha subunit